MGIGFDRMGWRLMGFAVTMSGTACLLNFLVIGRLGNAHG